MPVLEVVMRANLFGQNIQNTYFYEGPTLNISDGQALAEELRDLYETHFQASLTPNYDLVDALVRIASTQGQPYVVAAFPDMLGANVTQDMPPQDCLLLNFSVAVPAPNRKRIYLSGFGEGLNVDGRPLAALITLGEQFMADVNGLTVVNGKACNHVVTRQTGTPPYVTQTNILTTVSVSQDWARLASRKRG